MKGGVQPPAPRKPPLPTDAAAAGLKSTDAFRRRKGFLSTILTGGGNDTKPLLGS